MGESLIINGSSHEFRSPELVCEKAGLVPALRAFSPSNTEGYGDRRSLEAYGPADRVPASHGTQSPPRGRKIGELMHTHTEH